MKIVKLTFNFDFPIFRQTSNYSQIWGDYRFIIDKNLKECDFWVIYGDFDLKQEIIKCYPNNIIYLTGEGYFTSVRYGQKFLDQFSKVITVQRNLKHKNILYKQTGLPWFINKSYDELINSVIPKKKKLLSVVCSNKVFTEGHKKRLNFVLALKEHFKEELDVFGRGFNEIKNKEEALIDYKYSIAIENDFCLDYVTEKFFDCLYSNTLSFYYGCPNLEDYVSENSFIRIDIDDIEKSINIIENSIHTNEYEKRKNDINKEKNESLNRDQFFPLITSILDGHNLNQSKKSFILNSNVKDNYNIKDYLKRLIPKKSK